MNWQLPYGAHPLAPFDHQVAGQSSMLRYDDTTVCKPLIAREHFVYKTLPIGLKEFTPEYRGEIEVRLAEKDGFLLLYGLSVNNDSQATPPCDCSFDDSQPPSPTPEQNGGEENNECVNADTLSFRSIRSLQDQCMIRVLESESYEVCPPVQEMNHGDAVAQHPSGLNPWSLKNHKRLLDKMRKSEHSQNSIRFILLKNVVADFKCPCILDLKIGSRLHGDEADCVKVESQSRKCRETTSSTIGVRLCGMQVYQKRAGTYTSYDKYHGRTLKDDTFKEALISFLHNGIRSRIELLQPIVSLLSKLIHCLENVNSYRFYASSLLIIYDGEESGDPSSPPNPHFVSTKDSALRKNGLHLPCQGANSNLNQESSSDKNYAVLTGSDKMNHEPYSNFGDSDACDSEQQMISKDNSTDRHFNQTLVSSAPSSQLDVNRQSLSCKPCDVDSRKLPCEPTLRDCSDVQYPSEEFVNSTTKIPADEQSIVEGELCTLSCYEKVEVKMIDFAHTTHKGFPRDLLRHEGPDTDYIRGLTNLKELFKQLLAGS